MIRAFLISFIFGLAIISIASDLAYNPQPTEAAIENIHKQGAKLSGGVFSSLQIKTSGNPSLPQFKE